MTDQKDKNKELVQENSSLKSQLLLKNSIIDKLQERINSLEMTITRSSKLKADEDALLISPNLEDTKKIGGLMLLPPEPVEASKSLYNMMEIVEKEGSTPNYRTDPPEALTPPPKGKKKNSLCKIEKSPLQRFGNTMGLSVFNTANYSQFFEDKNQKTVNRDSSHIFLSTKEGKTPESHLNETQKRVEGIL